MICGVREHDTEMYVIFKTEEVKADWREERTEELSVVYIIISSRMKLGGIREYRNAYKIVKGKTSRGQDRGKYNIKTDLRIRGCIAGWIHLA